MVILMASKFGLIVGFCRSNVIVIIQLLSGHFVLIKDIIDNYEFNPLRFFPIECNLSVSRFEVFKSRSETLLEDNV